MCNACILIVTTHTKAAHIMNLKEFNGRLADEHTAIFGVHTPIRKARHVTLGVRHGMTLRNKERPLILDI